VEHRHCRSRSHFNSLLRADRSATAANVWTARPFTTKRQARVKNYSNKIYSETNSKVGRLVLNALASNAAPAPNLLAPSAILSSSVRAGLASSGEADPFGRYRWNALSSTRWEMTAALPPYICAPCDLSAIVPPRRADPPTAYIWSAHRSETILLKTRNSRVASRVPGYFF
jgi:hypothetical protein